MCFFLKGHGTKELLDPLKKNDNVQFVTLKYTSSRKLVQMRMKQQFSYLQLKLQPLIDLV